MEDKTFHKQSDRGRIVLAKLEFPCSLAVDRGRGADMLARPRRPAQPPSSTALAVTGIKDPILSPPCSVRWDPGRTQAIIRRLTKFGTRQTPSSEDLIKCAASAPPPPGRSARCRPSPPPTGCMTVQEQSFAQPAGSRIPTPVTITNVIATLQGIVSPQRLMLAPATSTRARPTCWTSPATRPAPMTTARASC